MAAVIETADAAKEAAAKRFNQLFVPLGIRNPLDQKFYPIAPLAASDFKVAEQSQDRWTLVREELSGPTVRATVGKATGLVQFDPLELSVE